MASKSFLLLAISLLVVATKVSSYDELKIEVNYVKPPVTAPATPVKPPSTPVVIVPTPPPVKPPPPPLVKAPPPPPPAKAPITTPPPPVKPPSPAPPVVKPPVAPAAPIIKSKKDCIPLCGYRCKLHSRKGLCMRACVTCCDRCKCVPPGTYGNREKCGKCYTDMLTHGNKPKCP